VAEIAGGFRISPAIMIDKRAWEFKNGIQKWNSKMEFINRSLVKPGRLGEKSCLGMQEGQATPQKKLPSEVIGSPAEIPPTQPSPVATPGQTPVKSPPCKRSRPEVHRIESQPTLELGAVVEVQDEILPDRQEEEESPASPMRTSPFKVSPQTWMFSANVTEMVHEILLGKHFNGDVGALADLREWPNNVPRTPLTWVLEWKNQNYPVPFPWIVNHDENRSSTIEMMAASARDALISAQELVKQDVLVQEKFEKTCAVTDRLEEDKLSDLRAKFGGKHLEDAKKGVAEFCNAQRKKAQAEMDTALAQHRQQKDDTVEQVVALLRYMMESHDLIVAKNPPELDAFLKDLTLELQSSLEDPAAAETPTPRVLFAQTEIDTESALAPSEPTPVNGERSTVEQVPCFVFFDRADCSWDPFIE